MQLASSVDNQPWICTVYYVADGNLNIYWLSWTTRRHSQEIKANCKVAVTIPIKLDRPVTGVQAEGKASEVTDAVLIEEMMKKYTAKYDAGHEFYKNFMDGKNKHTMYKFTPAAYVLFDEFNFPDEGRQELRLV